MNKEEYLAALRRSLAQMPAEERERQLAYYDELISDMCEDGMTETEATARLGDPAAVAQELLAALPLGTLVRSRIKSESRPSALVIVLLVLGFPVWFPLIVSFFAVVLSVFITLWALAISLAAAVLALGISAVAIPIAAVAGVLTTEASPLVIVGLMLVLAGLCVIGALAIPPLFRGIARLCRAFVRGVKSIFIKKGN
ncbi:MAG: DUF1700 domain-containing protein [Oscillospiraceae bacterium]|nr:DUF1700 domain-containing protein [Oscillospiraceae bacterium]